MTMLEKTQINDKIEVINNGNYPVIQVRTATIITDDGVEISRNFHRHVLTPDADLTNEDTDVVAIAQRVFTAQVKQAYAAYQASLGPQPIQADVVE